MKLVIRTAAALAITLALSIVAAWAWSQNDPPSQGADTAPRTAHQPGN
ncbi:MAG: hypothetical protein KGJ44_08730 [Betaproteobacteria bacterium]|nr:hypothetical protein [Betaproteobacteria bacterium]MDE2048479.1 hypothetical protein [Betaproteobacteria bacterium]